jgi:hypothetical protein
MSAIRIQFRAYCKSALPQKSKNGVRWYPQFPGMSQRDYGLQPRVAASATLGTSNKRILNRNAVAVFSPRTAQNSRNRFAVEGQIPALPRVAEAATLG